MSDCCKDEPKPNIYRAHHAGKPEAHDKHAGHHTADFLSKFWIALVLCVPIFFYSEMAQSVFGIRGPIFAGWQYVLLVLGSVTYFYCGAVFLTSAYRELRARLPGMMTLIALAITAAYVYSAYSILSGGAHELLFELSSLIAIMLLGHFIEMRSVASAEGALRELSRLLPDTAEVVRGADTQTIPLSELVVGDIVLVRPGGKIPADGTVVDGRSDVNESILTGESKPVEKERGSAVIAGSLNGEGALKIAVTVIGEKTFLSGVMRLVAEAETSKSRLQMLSDRAAFYLTLIAIVAGGVTFGAWLFVGSGVGTAIERLVAVLVITCPHALGLAVPLVAAISTAMAAKNGFLVRRRLALEEARKIDTVLFDKTGTLTHGAFAVTEASSDEALRLAASVDAYSQHPIGKAIVEEAKRRKLELSEVLHFKSIPGSGAEAIVDGAKVFVGHRGGSGIVVEKNGEKIGAIALSDTVRSEAAEAVRALKAMGLSVVMVTGDSEDVARSVAAELGISNYFSRVRPEEKSKKVRELRSRGRRVAMVGDGVNDAPALAEADLGIAVGAGTNVAIESAGIILVRNDPRDIPKVVRLSRLTYRKMLQNLLWATGYNVAAIPLAAGALASKGVILEPWLAAILMSASTVIVAANAVILRRQKL